MKYKTNFIWAAAGFILSFFAGLLTGVGFVSILLRAFIFAIVFFLVYTLINYLYMHFLTDTAAFSQEEKTIRKEDTTRGNIVDISLKDTDIPDFPNGPQFPIENIHKIVTSEDITGNNSDASSLGKNSDMQREKSPDSVEEREKVLDYTENDSSGVSEGRHDFASVDGEVEAAEKMQMEGEPSSSKAADGNLSTDSDEKETPSEEEVIDDLPDIENFVRQDSNDTSDVIEDSSFSTFDSTKVQDNKKTMNESKDTVVMAKAIRTMLKKDEL